MLDAKIFHKSNVKDGSSMPRDTLNDALLKRILDENLWPNF